ncbi:BREX system P-loop protein BrxC [Anaerotignum propionicum]|uniref:BREX system P-loop protein BrxC n=1 Tax=Anaerotignum propionicum TaxID=28446 RepID=UPI0028A24E09|nr:BREX system P-loop protein BrxC [Anaerotignum propionicum]
MIIKNMFSKPIDRDIKGVIKVGQGDDENVKQELEEYVVTRELQKHFADFFASYKKGIVGNTDKMGVWISGFFGSGKSHFLKILSYLLENRVVDGKTAIDYFVEDKKIKDEMVLGDMKLAANTPADVILFNIDSKSGMADTQNNKEAILSVFIKVFNQHLGFYGANPHLADLERTLTEEGKYEEFKSAFLSIRGKEWTDSRHQFRFIQDYVCKALVQIDYMSMEAAKNTCESFTNPYNMDISTFAKMVSDYIKKKGNNHHVIFLVDEIGQYIGEKTDLMLNLQTVAEDLGTECKGKAWIIVTSQQDIDSITKTRGNDFSKIQGRFDTRLSLSSANVDEVIRKRILEKTETGNQTLSLLYDDKDTIIKNLIIFNDGIEKKLYSDRANFSDVYPFIPYQFNLLGDVLTSIRTHGASGKHLAEGERSMLALFKESAMRVMLKNEGALVPFNMFYDALEQFLDHSHKGVIIRAYDNEYLNPNKLEDCFEVNVLKTLFMIKYVKEITPNLENITSLMVSDIDDDRIALKDKVEQALKRLCRQTLVQKNGEIYIFLTDEEQEINREIETQNVESSELTGKISELIFDGLYDEKKYRYPTFNGRYTFGFNQIVDDRPYKANQNYDISLKVLTPNFTDAQMDETTLRMMSGQSKCVIVALPDDKGFIDEIRSALKIEKYLRLNSTNVVSKYEQIKEAKRVEMRERNANARIFLEEAMKQATIYMNGDKAQIAAKDISSRINDALGKLISTVFHKLSYIDTAMNESHIRAVLKGNNNAQLSLDGQAQTPNRLALNDVLDFVSMNTQRHAKTSLKSIMERFTKAPYGFIEDDVEWLVAKLFKEGDLAFFVNNDSVTLLNKSEDEVYRYLSRKEFLEKLLTEKREKANDKQKKAVRDVMKELFNITPMSEEDDAILKSFMQYADRLKNELEKLEIHYKNEQSYPGKQVVKNGKAFMMDLLAIKYSAEFFKIVTDKQDTLLDFAEDYEPIKAFFHGDQIEIWNRSLKLMKIYDDSKTFIVNSGIEDVVTAIKAIMAKAKPYSEIRKIPELLERYTNLYNDMLTQMEEPITTAIEEARLRVIQELEGKECRNILSTKITERFAEIKKKAETCNNVATLQNIKVEADALKVRLLNEIAMEEAKIIAAKQPVTPIEVTSDGEKEIPQLPVPKAKTQKTISIKSINSESTWRIETEEDVDKYINILKEKLKQSIKEDIILNVEF